MREWREVAGEAKRTGAKAHIGRIFETCVEKGAELLEGDPGRKIQGRFALQGNNVHDEKWNVALFQDLSSCPATMAAANCADIYGLLAGHAIEQCDAEQAYTQSKIGGDPTGWSFQKSAGPKNGVE